MTVVEHMLDEQIIRSDVTICRHIESLDAAGRDAVSQDILQNIRTFVEHAMFKIHAHANNAAYEHQNIEQAISSVKTKGQLKFLLLVLIGDIYQMETIQSGDCFSAARNFLPKTSVCELQYPYRSRDAEMQTLWDRVRSTDDRITETVARNRCSATLNISIFEPEYGVARGGRSPIALKSNFKTRSTSIEDQQGSRRS